MGFILLFILTEVIFYFSFIMMFVIIAKKISNTFKNNANKKYFKNNVIYGTTINPNNDFLDITLNDLTTFKNKTNQIYKENYKDVSSNKLELFNVTDIDELKDYFYKIFYDFERAYNNLDYQTMKALSTSQLFENYYTGITLDLKEGNKRIIDNIKRKKMTIYELDSTIAKQVVSTYIEISYWNYKVDKHGNVISGCKDPVIEKFVVHFRKDIKLNTNTNCPNCGAPLNGITCSYCETVVTNKNDFKISSIKRIV